MIHLRFFASLRERLGVSEERLALPDGVTTVQQLTDWLGARGPAWADALADPRLITARNQSVVSHGEALQDGDEIAWFPPVTGG